MLLDVFGGLLVVSGPTYQHMIMTEWIFCVCVCECINKGTLIIFIYTLYYIHNKLSRIYRHIKQQPNGWWLSMATPKPWNTVLEYDKCATLCEAEVSQQHKTQNWGYNIEQYHQTCYIELDQIWVLPCTPPPLPSRLVTA